MKRKSVLLAAAVFLFATAVFAQQTVKVEDIADKVIEKGLSGINTGVYQGSVFVASLADYARDDSKEQFHLL